jgi:GNAT superfamily N-acetyltransferase
MTHVIRPATVDDVPDIVHHREQMFREMGTHCDYARMAEACAAWYLDAVPAGTYRGWMIEDQTGGPGTVAPVVGGGGLIVMPWSPGPLRFDPRMAFVYNVYVQPAHRGRELARRLMETMHAWCRSEGIERLALNATDAGKRVYASLGYAATLEPMMRLDL